MKNVRTILLSLCICVSLSCCKTIAGFDQYAYTQATSLKVDVLNLADKTTGSYAAHVQDCEKVISDLLKLREYEKHRPKDIITYTMWDKMIDSTGQKGIVGAFFAKWKEEDKQRPVFISDAKKIIAQGFDLISELESKKIKSDNDRVQTFIKN